MEMQLKQIKSTTLKDLKSQNKERVAEIEVLKEMVKSANLEVRARDIDIQKLRNRIQRLGGGERELSADSGSRIPR
jgi:hypothetical protein